MNSGLGKAILIGTVAGMRCFLAPALLFRKASASSDGCGLGVAALELAAAGELIADKTPFIGKRIDTGPLIGRLVSGASCGAVVGRRNGSDALPAAIAGGIAALISAHVFYLARREIGRSTGMPDIALALAEDALAFGIAREALK